MGDVQAVLDPAAEPGRAAGIVVAFGGVLVLDRLQDAGVEPGQRVVRAGLALVHQPPQTLLAPGVQQLPDPAAGQPDLGRLGLHPLPLGARRVVVRPRLTGLGVVRVPGPVAGGGLQQMCLQRQDPLLLGVVEPVQQRTRVQHQTPGRLRRLAERGSERERGGGQ